MTNEEALKYFKLEVLWHKDESLNKRCKTNAARLAAIEALEKQIPKKAKNHDNNFYYECPVCHCKWVGNEFKYCSECGQRFSWE